MKKIIIVIIIYFIIYSVCCQPMVIMASKSLDLVGINNQIGLCKLEDKVYNHYYIIINDKAYEPRFLGLYLCDHINYNPYKIYTADELMNRNGFLPKTSLIIEAVKDLP